MMEGTPIEIVGLLALMAVPALGLFVLFVVMERWGRKNDPMPRTKFEFLTPKSHRASTGKDER